MRILLVSTSLIIGGAETQVYLLAREFAKRGHSVYVVSLFEPKDYVKELRSMNVEVVGLGIRGMMSVTTSLVQLRRIIRTWKPDIIHAHMFHAIFLSRLARSISTRAPLISTTHNFAPESSLRRFLYRLTDLLGTITTNVSQVGSHQYVNQGAVPPTRMRYVPNGIDLTQFTAEPESRDRKRLNLGLGEGFAWLAVGRLISLKDYPTMIEAFAELKVTHGGSTLLIVGSGEHEAALRGFAKAQLSPESIRFLGKRTDVSELMAASDAYVMSSSSEGLALVLLEAAAARLPIVATDVGGNSEIVQDGISGFLVPAKSPQALARAMATIEALSESERRGLGGKGREHVATNYAITHVTQLWLDLYASLLA